MCLHDELTPIQTEWPPGPGFDVLGLALKATSASQKFSVCLELYIEQLPEGSSVSGNCEIICKGEGAGTFSTACEENLVTKVALYVLRSHGIRGSVSYLSIVSDFVLQRLG